MSFGAVHLAFYPCSKLQGISAKANKKVHRSGFYVLGFAFWVLRSGFCVLGSAFNVESFNPEPLNL
jgi:hypothetical protein